jgi:DnaJ-class molecular chaperone
MKENPYNILGIPFPSNRETVKKAFRSLALRFHPDKLSGIPETERLEAENRFKQIKVSYEFLLKNIKEPAPIPENKPLKPKRGSSLAVNISVSLKDIFIYKQKKIVINRLVACKKCRGTGDSDQVLRTCQTCGGTKIADSIVLRAIGKSFKDCPDCNGLGIKPSNPCSDCRGQSVIKITDSIVIPLKSMVDGKTFEVLNKGNAGVGGGKPGDLLVTTRIKTNNYLSIDGEDLVLTLPISPAKYALGGNIIIRVLGIPLKVNLPKAFKSLQVPFHRNTIRILPCIDWDVPKSVEYLYAQIESENQDSVFPKDF